MTYIIGIDPGKSLGIAVMEYPKILEVYQGEVETGIVWLKNQLDIITRFAPSTIKGPIIYVAIEKFTITPGTGRKSGASKTAALVGQFEAIAKSYEQTSVYLQSVSDASRIDNVMLKRLGLLVSAGRVKQKDANDANSAVRHILLCLARNRADLFEKLITTSGVM